MIPSSRAAGISERGVGIGVRSAHCPPAMASGAMLWHPASSTLTPNTAITRLMVFPSADETLSPDEKGRSHACLALFVSVATFCRSLLTRLPAAILRLPAGRSLGFQSGLLFGGSPGLLLGLHLGPLAQELGFQLRDQFLRGLFGIGLRRNADRLRWVVECLPRKARQMGICRSHPIVLLGQRGIAVRINRVTPLARHQSAQHGPAHIASHRPLHTRNPEHVPHHFVQFELPFLANWTALQRKALHVAPQFAPGGKALPAIHSHQRDQQPTAYVQPDSWVNRGQRRRRALWQIGRSPAALHLTACCRNGGCHLRRCLSWLRRGRQRRLSVADRKSTR